MEPSDTKTEVVDTSPPRGDHMQARRGELGPLGMRLVLLSPVAYGFGWIVAALLATALAGYESALWAAIAAATGAVLSSRHAARTRHFSTLGPAAVKTLVGALVVPAVSGALAVLHWQDSWAPRWQATLGYHLGWLAALLAGAAAYTVLLQGEREAHTTGEERA